MGDALDERVYGLQPRWITRLLLGLVVIFAIMLLTPSASEKGTIALCLLASVSLTIFWPMISGFDNLKIGASGIELSKRVDEAATKADKAASAADDALATITRFVFNSMPKPTFENLQKVSKGFGRFEMNEGFRSQLRSLRDSGYIATKDDSHIGTIPSNGAELNDYVYCTSLGQEFIRRRLAIEAVGRS